MSRQKCSVCKKFFEQNDSKQVASMAQALGREPSEQLCYSCALKKVTGGSCPEEGDFNSASLISGEMTDQELQWLQADLRAVETGCSVVEPMFESDDEDIYEDVYGYEDSEWEDDEEDFSDEPGDDSEWDDEDDFEDSEDADCN